MPEVTEQVFDSSQPVTGRNRHAVLIGSVALFTIIAAVGGWVYFTYTPEDRSPYGNGVTAFSVLVKENSAFAEADLLFKDRRYIEARAKYNEALALAKDSIQESQIRIKIAHTYFFNRELVEAVRLYKEIANNQNYGDLVRAYSVAYMAMAYDYNGDTAVLEETFKGEPYASMFDPNDISLSYRRLFEYASSFRPLAVSELRIAIWYTLDVAKTFKSMPADEQAEYRSRIEGYLQNAETDIARLKSDPNESAVLPEILKRKAILLGYLAIGGIVPHEQAEKAYSDALLLASTLNLGEDGFVRYFYALYLTLVGNRENEVIAILSPLYTDSVYARANITSFLESERVNRLNHKVHIVRMAEADPAFKRFLLSRGWTESDFN